MRLKIFRAFATFSALSTMTALKAFSAFTALILATAVLTLASPPKAKAEYRVFNLRISTADGTQTREVTSTLDPDQYRGYHTVRPDENIVYTNTWRCKGRTSNYKEFCPDPKRTLAADGTTPAETAPPTEAGQAAEATLPPAPAAPVNTNP
jgi:hypothetical protein